MTGRFYVEEVFLHMCGIGLRAAGSFAEALMIEVSSQKQFNMFVEKIDLRFRPGSQTDCETCAALCRDEETL